MTDEKIIVLVSDRDDSKHGEISVLDDAQKAERLVEALLEAGFEAGRIRVFSGKASEFQVSHRPVVALATEGEDGAPQTVARAGSREGEAHERPAAKPVADEPPAPPRKPAADQPLTEEQPAAEQSTAAEDAPRGEREAQTEVEATEEEEAAAAEVAGPVKFSSLFRSA